MWNFWKIPKEFHWNSENSTIFGIFGFLLQNQIQGFILSGKNTPFGQTDKLVIFIERFHRFQKLPELLEFLDSDYRIGFSDQYWVGKMPHIVILVQNDQIRRKIRNRLIKISWNQLIFLSHQSWLESHLYWIYNWFLKIPTGNLLFRAFYVCIKWADWPS